MALFTEDSFHPLYNEYIEDWAKWRIAYRGGRLFINKYLERFSRREDTDDFELRRKVTYCPRFAGAGVDEVKNSIYQRMIDITRQGGTQSYLDAIKGGSYGVDLLGSSMTSFIGRKVLIEMLIMRKVGIYVDMPAMLGDNPTIIDQYMRNIRPYLYVYNAEDILNWSYDEGPNYNEFTSVLLREHVYKYSPVSHMPIDRLVIQKQFWTENGRVWVKILSDDEELNQEEPIPVNLPRIPFVVPEISRSLMEDIADYQIGLLNLASSDMNSIRFNFPLYIEQEDPRAASPYTKRADKDSDEPAKVDMGPASGRTYSVGMNAPSFINPSSEPLKASMEKQDKMKDEIRSLLNLTVSDIQAVSVSAESKGFDERTLESGLSYIGLELEHAEQQIGQIWAMYENSKQYPTIKYPERYNLKSDEDRRKDCTDYQKLATTVPSNTFRKEVNKRISHILLEGRVQDATIKLIDKEIDAAKVTITDPLVLSKDVEQGILPLDYAASAKGYPEDSVTKAKQDHTDRLARIALTQSPDIGPNGGQARGVGDLGNPGDGSQEKNQSKGTDIKSQDGNVTDHVRGKGEGL